MIFHIDSQLSQALSSLQACDGETIDNVCHLAFEHLQGKSKQHDYNVSADLELVDSRVRAVMTLVIQLIKHNCSDNETTELLASIHCNEQFITKFTEFYKKYQYTLSGVLTTYNDQFFSINRFVQLNWRFEVRISSKYLREQFEPMIRLRFKVLGSNNQPRCVEMVCTLADIHHMINTLKDIATPNDNSHLIQIKRTIK